MIITKSAMYIATKSFDDVLPIIVRMYYRQFSCFLQVFVGILSKLFFAGANHVTVMADNDEVAVSVFGYERNEPIRCIHGAVIT